MRDFWFACALIVVGTLYIVAAAFFTPWLLGG